MTKMLKATDLDGALHLHACAACTWKRKGKLRSTLLITDRWHFSCKPLVSVMASKRKHSCCDAA